MLKSFVIPVFFLAGALVATAFFSVPTMAATTLETVVGECKERTGFGDATCMTLVKKYMNVERCKEYTGYSDEECAKKIEEIKKDPGFSGGGTNSSSSSATTSVPPRTDALPTNVTRGQGALVSLREKKERDLLALWKRTEVVTDLLKKKGFDTQAIESAFPEFERKAEALLSAYDTYRSAYDGTVRDVSSTRQSIRSEAKNNVLQAQRQLIDHYRTNILVPLRTAREQAL